MLLDLGPEEPALKAVPTRVKGTIKIEAKSESIAPAWKRSRYVGHLEIHVTSLDGATTFFDLKTQLEGEADGSPSQGMGQMFTRAWDVLAMAGTALRRMNPESRESGKE